jgi:glycosyltransferase involved in cell wall biosynthesis
MAGIIVCPGRPVVVDKSAVLPPRLSILVPNFNNGRASSRSRRRDFADDLFSSLARTLERDPTPLEIIVADDGSTDDSLATCRQWAGRTWRGGQPFCRLLEQPHCGVLSVVANRMTSEARGELCCRLDGDVTVLTPNWAASLCRIFDGAAPGLGIVGAKQLSPDGRIHPAGDWVLHPRGYHHVGQGADRAAVSRTIEVDHVMGCFYAHRRSVWEDLNGYDETLLRGQTVDFSLRARLAGWRVIAAPTIEFVHHHTQRAPRDNRADTDLGLTESLDRFRAKWGFDRLAANLDDVTDAYAGTPLLWNASVFGPSAAYPTARPQQEPAELGRSEWVRFTADAEFRRAVLWRVELFGALSRRLGPRRRVGHVNARAGLLCHFLARGGVTCVGIEPEAGLVGLARTVTGRETYPGPAPSFVVQGDPRRLPLDDGELDTLLLFDVVERHPNPVGLYEEAHRVLAPGGVLLIETRLRAGPLMADVPGCHAYRPHELQLQLRASRCFEPLGDLAGGAEAGHLVIAARRIGRRAERCWPAGLVQTRACSPRYPSMAGRAGPG